MFIGVAGLIGAGKSTFTKQLAAHLGTQAQIAAHDRPDREQPFLENVAAHHASDLWGACYEPVETNPFLEDFYKDIPRWTFAMQMFLLSTRFQQHQEVLWDSRHRKGGGVVQDRTIYEDTIFARMHRDDGLMPDREWETYINHFHIMQGFLRYPDVIVYLRVTPEKALERIMQRGRDAEKGLPLAYLQQLFVGYEEFVKEMERHSVVVTIDWSEYQPVEEVAKVIMAATDHDQKFLRSLRRI